MNNGAEIKAILFDLDGTLLPMDQNHFIRQYFKRAATNIVSYGVDPNKFIECVMFGTEAMIRNNGLQTNEKIFWERFFESLGERREELKDTLDGFYFGEFKQLIEETSPTPLAAAIVEKAHANGRKVVLATNPLFPMSAQLERISWLGLSEKDFDLITSYENSTFSKPNPKYYLEICQKIGVEPQNCLMIGNDESDDMKGASEAGCNCFLMTDCRIISNNFVWTGERGSFEQAIKLIERI